MTLSLKDSKKNSNLKNKLGIIFAIKKILFFNKRRNILPNITNQYISKCNYEDYKGILISKRIKL